MKSWNTPYLAGLGIFAGSAVLGIARRGTSSGVVLLSVAGVVGIIIIVVAVTQRRLGREVDNAAQRRPGAVVIPAYTTGEMIDLGLQAGASVKGWRAQGGNPAAIVVAPEGIEVWSGREPEPRWTLPRAEIQEVGLFSGTFGAREIGVAGVSAAHGGLMFVPAYRPLRNMGGADEPGLERALSELGTFASR